MRNLSSLIKILISALFLFACAKDKIDISNIDTSTVKWQPGVKLPIAYGTFSFEDLINPEEDSIDLVFYEDSIVYTVRQDSLIDFTLSNFLDSEATLEDVINGFSAVNTMFNNPLLIDIPITKDTLVTLDTLTILPEFEIIEGIDIDSIKLVNGEINIQLSSTYESSIILHYWSDSSVYIDNQLLNGTILLAGPGTYNETISLDGATIAMHTNKFGDYLTFDVSYALQLDAKAGETLSSSASSDITASIDNLNSYEYIYGYFGQLAIKEFSEEDTFNIDFPENLNKLSGTFSIGNPRIKFLYTNSFGLDEVFDIGLKANFPDNTSDSAVFSPATFLKPTEISYNSYRDSTYYGGSQLNNILRLPPPENLSLIGSIFVNPNGREMKHNYINFITPESTLGLGVEIDIPLQFGADLEFRDTLLMADLLGNDATNSDGEPTDSTQLEDIIDWVQLHYTFKNGFPLGFDVDLILYSQEEDIAYETIKLSATDNAFLEPAPVDDNGVVIKNFDDVPAVPGIIELTSENVKRLSDDADAIILVVKLKTTATSTTGADISAVKILPDYKMYFKLGLVSKFDVNLEL